jgi:hypothetical protein
MNCEKLQAFLPDMLLDPTRVPADAHEHLRLCGRCDAEWKDLQSTIQLLNNWQVPEPNQYFATRLSARIQEERDKGPAGLLERLRMRLLFGSNLQLRPVMAGGFALLLIVTGGSYAGFVSLNRTVSPSVGVSATVTDLELLDSNAQTLQQMAAFDDTGFNTADPANGSVSN